MSDQELKNKIVLLRFALLKASIKDEPFDEAELWSLTSELLRREAQSKFDELTQGTENDVGTARLGFDEPILELLTRDRFLHSVRCAHNVENCLADHWQFAAKSY